VPVTVTDLALVPVKGMRVTAPDAVTLEPAGAVGDRAFFVVDAHDGALLLTTRTPRLVQVRPEWDAARGVLTLDFPDGETVAAAVEPGAPALTHSYDGRELRGRRVDGALAAALSAHLGREVALLARDPGVRGADDFPVSLMSLASLRALAPVLDGTVPDPRRFRMTITVDGADAWEEEDWRELAIGDAVLRTAGAIPRCAVTTRDPESGRRDAPVLRGLAQLRGKRRVDFGVWCEVVEPGTVRRGDPVSPV
jgi:MOSC domain-containing protein